MIPSISVCIPAYNRAPVLPALLDSILSQDSRDFEVVICEDRSPQRAEIARIVAGYRARHPGLIRYIENAENLGYDANLRNLVERARGRYCLFMGNDDLMCPGALGAVSSAVERYDNVGVVLRSYASFDGVPESISEEFRYFPSEKLFRAGEDAITTIYRRSVVISGMVIQREAARSHATDRFDGTLLYQLYLVACVLTTMNAVFLPDILVLYRSGGVPEFGASEAERGKFVPKQQTPESSLHFMKGMLEIAGYVERTRGVRIYRRILRDVGNYSYPVLAVQSDKPFPVFVKYCYRLARLGFWNNKLFYLYFLSLVILGRARVERIIRFIKRRLGYTPAIGDIYKGRSA
ncbi:MAG: glycosyltransferase family 2 protein [Betaproteobacteria bacterium]|nr:glycosyltransferase family 2 protein [Betaproteobacteria bacterium]